MPDAEQKNAPLEIIVREGKLVISIGIESLARTATYEYGGPLRRSEVEMGREQEWAEDVAAEIKREDHDGGTPLDRFLDRMMKSAVREGSGAVVPK